MSRDADADEIKKAYRRLARRWHPDLNKASDAADRFKELAAAFEVLSDPVRRRAHDAAIGRVHRGELPKEFLDHAMSAIERAQLYAERVVVPFYARHWRGNGAEMAARLWMDLDQLADLSRLRGVPGRAARRRAETLLANVHVTLETWPTGTLSQVVRTFDGQWLITLTPWALYRAGFREPGEIDDAMLKVVLARYAQILATGRFLPPADPEDWDHALQQARSQDNRVLAERWGQRGFWALVASVVLLLLYAGFAGW